jgi:DNA-binding transcriptional regulator YdaS (Cro superfamily)
MSALQEFLAVRGAMSDLAKALGITHAAVGQWAGRCPAERVVDVERITGIPREALRPDLYRRAPSIPTRESAS